MAVAYYELLRAEGLRAVNLQMRGETAEVANITAKYAATGVGREADAERAATELAQRETDVLETEGQVMIASANLCRLLNLDPSLRLHVTDGWVVPTPIVPDPITLSELVAMAMLQRPDLAERRAAIQEAFLSLQSARVLPFSPNTLVGFSAGTFGGGSNLVASGTPPAPTTPGPRFGNFASRDDFDVVVYWTLQNLGYGNRALIDAARARLRQSDFQQLIVLNQARAEVATAYAAHARTLCANRHERTGDPRGPSGLPTRLPAHAQSRGIAHRNVGQPAFVESREHRVFEFDRGFQRGTSSTLRCARSAARRHAGSSRATRGSSRRQNRENGPANVPGGVPERGAGDTRFGSP